MADQHDSNSGGNQTDDIISSYLGDLLGSSEPVEESSSRQSAASLKQQLVDALNSATIEKRYSLISTQDLYALTQSKPMLNKSQAFLFLLFSLYFLRRPLPNRVRKAFLDVSERMLDDYEAADWQAQISHPKGVRSEARS